MKKGAFTLVELIVGITISMVLMVSVGIFIGGGIKNITLQEKVIDGSKDLINFSTNISNTFNHIDTSFTPVSTSSGYIVKLNKEFDSGGYVYIGEATLSGSYCEYDSYNPSLDLETNHIFIKSFIPYEEAGEDIFSDYSQILTGSVLGYTSYQKEHVIRDSGNNIIVGKGVFGNYMDEGEFGTGIYLNSPTGLAIDGNNLYISDTLNHRILVYNTSTFLMSKLLDDKDGLLEPTGLYYDSINDELYIANSGRGEILKYSSNVQSSNPTLSLSFSGVTANITSFDIEFFRDIGTENISLSSSSGSYDVSNFSFSGISSSEDYSTGSVSNKLDYYFSNYPPSFGPDSAFGQCGGTEDIINYYLNSGVPYKRHIDCVSSGTGRLSDTGFLDNKILNSGTTYEINVDNIAPNLSLTGSYYVKLNLYNAGVLQNEQYFPYFIQGDDNLLTTGDNTLKVVETGLGYVTGIWGTGLGDYKIFGNPGYSDLAYDLDYDKKFDSPIGSLLLDNSQDLFTINMTYYKQLNCYNRDENVKRSFIFKKSFK